MDTIKTWDNIMDIKKGVETLVTPKSGFYNETKADMDHLSDLHFLPRLRKAGSIEGIKIDVRLLTELR